MAQLRTPSITALLRWAAPLPATVLVLGALAGTGRPASSKDPQSPTQDSTKPPAGARATSSWCEARVKATIRAASPKGDGREDTQQLREGPTPAPAAASPNQNPTEDRSQFDTEIIALVPDPIDSGLRRMFDEYLSAIRLAMAKEGWLPDRNWLPWHDPILPDPVKDDRLAALCRRDVPGVMIFRHEALPDRQAVVYVVGETPTWGVQRNALLYALGHVNDSHRIYVVGPAFSGSAPSLNQLIGAFKEGKSPWSQFQIIAGSANGSRLEAQLAGAIVNGRFQTTNLAAAELECAFWRYLQRERGINVEQARATDGRPRGPGRLTRVAILRESGTAFGVAPTSPGARDDGRAREAPAGPECPLGAEVELRFPIHIAGVRSAYAKSDHSSGAAAVDSLVRKTHLDVDLEEEAGTFELPDQSLATAGSRDAALAHLLEEVASEGIEYLGIVATDAVDAVFLARKVRDVAPDVRLCFFFNDILLLHPEFRSFMVGSYVVTAYPFLGSDDFEVSGAHAHTHWPLQSDNGEAVMNAIAIAAHNYSLEPPLGASPQQRAQAEAGFIRTGALVEYAWRDSRRKPFEGRRHLGPFIWIGAIGTTGVVPLDLAGPLAGGDVYQSPGDGPGSLSPENVELDIDDDVSPPVIWQFALAGLATLALSGVRSWRRRSRTLEDVPPHELLSDRDVELAILRMRIALTVAVKHSVVLVGLVYMLAYDLCALWYFKGTDDKSPIVLRWSVALLALVAVLLVLLELFHCAAAFRRRVKVLVELLGRQPAARLDHPHPLPAVDGPGRSGAAPGQPPRPTIDALQRIINALLATARNSGWYPGVDRRERVRFAVRLEVLKAALAVLVVAALLLVGVIFNPPARKLLAQLGGQTVEATLSLRLLRDLPLLDGVAAAWPTLCVVMVVWIWTRTRLEVLWSRHSDVLRAPRDPVERPKGVAATALPLSYMLGREEGLRFAELSAVDALHGASSAEYFLGLIVASILPVVVLILKPMSTLEARVYQHVLSGGLALAAFLTVSSLAQLIGYWRALGRLLDWLVTSRAGEWLGRSKGGEKLGTIFPLPGSRSQLGYLRGRCALLYRSLVEVPGLDDAEHGRRRQRGERMQEELDLLRLAASRDGRPSAGTEGVLVGCILSEEAEHLVSTRGGRKHAPAASDPSKSEVLPRTPDDGFVIQVVDGHRRDEMWRATATMAIGKADQKSRSGAAS